MPDGLSRDLPFLLLCAPSPKAVPGAKALLALSPKARTLDDPAMAGEALVDWPGARLVVFCPRPEVWLALALAAGEGPSQALQNWRAQVQPLIALLRARRRQTVLLFEDVFAAAPALCAATLGLPAPEAAIVAREGDDPVLILLAREALRHDPAAQALAEELLATGFSVSESAGGPDQELEAIFQTYAKGLARQSAAEAQIPPLTAEAALLREQIRLDAAAAERLQAALDAETKKRGAAETAQTAGGARLAALEAEATLLREQTRLDAAAIERLQAALDAETKKRGAAETAQRTADTRVAALNVETALLREQIRLDAAMHASERARAGEETGETIRQLRAQLHQMGQGLESSQVQLEALQDDRAGLLDRLREDLRTREQELVWLQGEIGRIHASRSYRLMAPLRKIRMRLR